MTPTTPIFVSFLLIYSFFFLIHYVQHSNTVTSLSLCLHRFISSEPSSRGRTGGLLQQSCTLLCGGTCGGVLARIFLKSAPDLFSRMQVAICFHFSSSLFFFQCLCTISCEDDNRSWFSRRKILRFQGLDLTGAPNYTIHHVCVCVCDRHCVNSISLSHLAHHSLNTLTSPFLGGRGDTYKFQKGARLACRGKSDLKAIAQFLN